MAMPRGPVLPAGRVQRRSCFFLHVCMGLWSISCMVAGRALAARLVVRRLQPRCSCSAACRFVIKSGVLHCINKDEHVIKVLGRGMHVLSHAGAHTH